MPRSGPGSVIRRILPVVLASALLAAAATGCSAAADAEQAPEAGPGWRQLPDPPLGPRDDAVVVGLGDRVLVVGGEEFSCPPNADCTASDDPLFTDGAVYDPATDAWSSIAPPPFGVRRHGSATAALEGNAYVVTTCADGPSCAAPPQLLSYRLDDDRWTDHGPVPGPQALPRRITPAGDRLLVYPTIDTPGGSVDLLFDPRSSTWTELPDDPLPLTYDRFVVPVGGSLVLAGSPSDAMPPGTGPEDVLVRFDRTLAARFDLDRGEWVTLPDAPGLGTRLLPSDRGPLLDGYDRGSTGWLLEPGSWTWSELPGPAPEHGLNGVIDREQAVYDLPLGIDWLSEAAPVRVYDSAEDVLRAVPPPPRGESVYGDAATASGRDLFVFGGQRYSDDGTRMGGGAWLWTAPTG